MDATAQIQEQQKIMREKVRKLLPKKLKKKTVMEVMQLQRIAYSPGFWFEWVAFHPDTLVFSAGDDNS